jgi:hypothetical protein
VRLTAKTAAVVWGASVCLAYVMTTDGAPFAAVLALVVPGATLVLMARADERAEERCRETPK